MITKNGAVNTKEEIIKSDLQKGNTGKVYFVMDFDMTLTQHYVTSTDTSTTTSSSSSKKKRNKSAHGVFSLSKQVSDEYKQLEDALFKKFYPMEMDPTLTVKEKIPLMQQWWQETHDLICSSKMLVGSTEGGSAEGCGVLTRRKLREIVTEVSPLIQFRTDYEKLLKRLHELKIPLLIFSAGIADVIEELLRARGLFYDNIHIVSNRMIFSEPKAAGEESKITGFLEPFIHVYNKNEFNAVHFDDLEFSTKLKGRDQVVLIGDSLGDVHMVDATKHSLVYSIGLLNTVKKVETEGNGFKYVSMESGLEVQNDSNSVIQRYHDTFDKVVYGDVSFEEGGIINLLY